MDKIFRKLIVCFSFIFLLSCSHVEAGKRSTASEAGSANPLPAPGLYNNPDSTALYQIIKAAKNSIDIEIYEMYDKAFLDLLNTALDNHVKIRLIKDPAPVGGDKCHLFPEYVHPSKKKGKQRTEEELVQVAEHHHCELQMAVKKRIEESGGQFVPFNKSVLCGKEHHGKGQCFEHGKIVVIDKEDQNLRKALISTGNFNSSSLCNLDEEPLSCNRDFSYITKDSEIIEGLENVFEHDLKEERFDPTTISPKLTVSPYSMDPLVAFIGSAQKYLQIENQYLKDPTLNAAIKAAAQKPGMTVRVQIASLVEFAPVKPHQAQVLCALFKDFQDAGVKIRIFTSRMYQQGKPGYLHAKAIVVDKQKAWVGSVNGSTTSLEENREYGAFINDARDVKHLSEILESDYSHEFSKSWDQQLDCGT